GTRREPRPGAVGSSHANGPRKAWIECPTPVVTTRSAAPAEPAPPPTPHRATTIAPAARPRPPRVLTQPNIPAPPGPRKSLRVLAPRLLCDIAYSRSPTASRASAFVV